MVAACNYGITLTGSKLCRLAYRFEGKRKVLAFGPYPEISLSMLASGTPLQKPCCWQEQSNGAKRADEQTQSESRAKTFSVLATEFLHRGR